MKKVFSSIHVINGDMEEVRNRLANCQAFNNELEPEKLNMLKEQLGKTKNTLLQTIKLISFLKKQEERTISFYSMERGNKISVFSEYFTFDNVFEVAIDYFPDLDNYILAFGLIEGESIRMDIVKKGKKLTSLICSTSDGETAFMDFNSQILKTCGLLSDVSELQKILNMSVDEISRSLESLLGLPLSLEIKDIDIDKPGVYVDDYYII